MSRSSRSTDDLDPRFRWGLTILLLGVAIFGIVDLVLDRPTGLWSLHVAFELAFVVLSLSSIVFLWLGWTGAHRSLQGSRTDLRHREVERDLWRARATRLLNGLGVEIDAQLERWGLTPAEKQVALLLLKGLGHKEAAEILERSERTIRQHAVSIYRKAGLSGRAELAAFFLEDLLLPRENLPPEEEADDAPSPPREPRSGGGPDSVASAPAAPTRPGSPEEKEKAWISS